MLKLLHVFSRAPVTIRQWRFLSTFNNMLDLRTRLKDEVKSAMKVKDVVTSTTLRSVLSEVYAADKTAGDKVSSSVIANTIRKAVLRRNEAANKFAHATRQDLADKELREVEVLSKFLPPSISEAEINHALQQVIEALPADLQPQQLLSHIFKEFYQKVDKSTVDANLVKRRATALLAHK